MATNLENLKAVKANYIQALADDSIRPLGNYSLDGESLDRVGWRSALLDRIKLMNELIQLDEPFELRTYVCP